MANESVDIGDYLAVPEDHQLTYDEPSYEDPNDDEFRSDFSDIPDGDYVELSTAHLDEEES